MKMNAVWKTILGSVVLGTSVYSPGPIQLSERTAMAAAAVFTPPAGNRVDYNFNLDWKFIRQDVTGAEAAGLDDSAWETVSLPHTFNDVDSFDEYITSGGEPNAYRGIVWYRKHLKLDAGMAGRKVFIEFEGVRQAAEVFVNGTSVGLYENGVTPFGFDITDYVTFGPGDNVIAVKADNSNGYVEKSSGSTFQWGSKDFNPNFGGLTRDVRLHVMDRAYMTLPLYEGLKTTGTYIYPSNISTANRTADLNVESQVKNEYAGSKTLSLDAVVVDRDGHAVGTISSAPVEIPQGGEHTFKLTGALSGLHLWQPDYPYLYTVYCILKEGSTVLDVYPIQTGFRKVDFRGGAATGGVYINNKLVFLNGYAQRSSNEWAALGVVPDWMHDYDGRLMKESNANMVRWMHVAAQPADIRTADKYGIVAVQPAGDKEGDASGRQWEQRVEVMRKTMIYFRNNPSILFWEAGNNYISAAHMKEMNDLKQQLDPNGMRAVGSRALSDDPSYGGKEAVDHAEYVGTMLNRHYSDYARDRVPLIESEYTRDEAPRRVWDDDSPPDFDYKRDPSATYDWTSEQFASTVAANSRNELWGQRIQGPGNSRYSGAAALIWSDSNQHGRNYLTENSRVSGRVDAVRIPKQSYYSYRVMQSSTPDIHLIGHWSYPAGTVKTMYVMAAHVAKVELFVNGVSKGVSTTPTSDFLYEFPNIAWEAGTIRAVGYDANNGVVTQTELETAGAPAAIKLTAQTGPRGLEADGTDVAMIDVEVVDAEGRRVPTDQARIDFAVTGPAEFEGGWNSGKLNSVHQSYVDTEAGINRVFVRSTRTPGAITLTATRDGLAAGTVTVESRAVDAVDGLTTVMPAGDQPALPVSVPDYGPDGTPGVNVALEKPAAADSTQPGSSPAYATDESAETGWTAADGNPGHYWQVDLESAQPIGGAEIQWAKNDSAYQYKIEVSTDNTNWTQVVDRTNNGSTAQTHTHYFTAVARYVRITATGGGLAGIHDVRIFKNEAAGQDWNITNYALDKPVTASSEESSNPAARAVDGSTNSRWSALTGTAGQWLQVDLGENRPIIGTEVLWYRTDRAYQYKIEVSTDSQNWTTAVDGTDNLTPEQKQSDSFTTEARYVRVTVTGGSWASIRELSVLGHLVQETDTEAPEWPAGSKITASDVTETGARLSWTQAADHQGVVSYNVYGDGHPNVSVTDSVYELTGLKPGTSYTFKVEAVDAAGNTSGNGPSVTFTTLPDSTIPPVTTAAVHPDLPSGLNGWYRDPVTITLTAASGTGEAQTRYSLDGGASWQTYTAPITLSKDGRYPAQYYSVNQAGTEEAVQSLNPIRIDRTAPVIGITSPAGGTMLDDQTAAVNYTVSDPV
ncbi:discoidin domain-containing protein [Paenibacillus sp. S-38]|uniref:discoidin domain-containing protein n=1 Tax=Paenibacillus sp. S-38 TaxID=3416710 RepID=UPI003CEEF470